MDALQHVIGRHPKAAVLMAELAQRAVLHMAVCLESCVQPLQRSLYGAAMGEQQEVLRVLVLCQNILHALYHARLEVRVVLRQVVGVEQAAHIDADPLRQGLILAQQSQIHRLCPGKVNDAPAIQPFKIAKADLAQGGAGMDGERPLVGDNDE